jgi:hypothetical protein
VEGVTVEPEQPTITTDPSQFLDCCENLLALRSFYIHSGEHCPDAIPLQGDGSFDVSVVEERTRRVGECLRKSVNRGEGTNSWNIPKFIDLLLLPQYMSRLGSTGRFHVGFAERGLKNWAKKPATTSQKRGGGVFEGQCAARIREKSMIDHALTQMDSDNDDMTDDENDDPVAAHDEIGGSCFHISIDRAGPNRRQKQVSCTRLNGNRKPHTIQTSLPQPILDYFKTLGGFEDIFEYRTEAVIEKKRYRAHPNFRGCGPWYDFVTVEFELDNAPDYATLVDDNNRYPAKLIGFYRLLSREVDEEQSEFQVLTHCVAFQRLDSEIYKKRSLLVRPWMYEVSAGRHPRPVYRIAGSVSSNIAIIGHIFAIEENPGFHERYMTACDKRVLVISDMRKVWPQLFIDGSRGEYDNDNND